MHSSIDRLNGILLNLFMNRMMIEILGGRLCAKALGCSWQWRDPARYWNLITIQEAGTRTLSMLFPKASVLHSEWNSEVAHPADRKMQPMNGRV